MRQGHACADDMVRPAVGMGYVDREVYRVVRRMERKGGKDGIPGRNAIGKGHLAAQDILIRALKEGHVLAGPLREALSPAVDRSRDPAHGAGVGGIADGDGHAPIHGPETRRPHGRNPVRPHRKPGEILGVGGYRECDERNEKCKQAFHIIPNSLLFFVRCQIYKISRIREKTCR